MYTSRTNDEGLSLAVNRVALPAIESFIETYTKLPDDLFLGFPAELEGLKGVLCRNSGTALAENVVAQRQGSAVASNSTVNDSNVFFDAKTGEKTLYIDAASIDADAWADQHIYLAGHPLPYIILENAASATISSVDDVVEVSLNRPLIKNVDSNTTLTRQKNVFDDVVIGAANGSKALGMTMASVPADDYFWAVYYGRIYKSVTAAAGDHIIKGASGAFAKLQIDADAAADYDFDSEILGIHEGSNLTFLDIQGIPDIAGLAAA